jgi:hypothetical protein
MQCMHCLKVERGWHSCRCASRDYRLMSAPPVCMPCFLAQSATLLLRTLAGCLASPSVACIHCWCLCPDTLLCIVDNPPIFKPAVCRV